MRKMMIVRTCFNRYVSFYLYYDALFGISGAYNEFVQNTSVFLFIYIKKCKRLIWGLIHSTRSSPRSQSKVARVPRVCDDKWRRSDLVITSQARHSVIHHDVLQDLMSHRWCSVLNLCHKKREEACYFKRWTWWQRFDLITKRKKSQAPDGGILAESRLPLLSLL